MLPRTHIILGAMFSIILWFIFPQTSWIYLGLVFLSSFLIDFDHYATCVLKTGRVGLFHSFEYHRRQGIKQRNEKKMGIRRRGDFHFFHTVEFHALVFVLGLFFAPFYYIFIGMIFHSLMDLISLIHKDFMYLREFFFVNWVAKKIR